MSMRISMPLAGMDPASQQLRNERDRLADEHRGFRLLSEGELFYVDTERGQYGDERLLGASRHDHGHLGGVSLEEVTQSMATRNPSQVSLRRPESIAETEAASRSSSQDSSQNTDNSWQHLQQEGSIPGSSTRSVQQQQQQQLRLQQQQHHHHQQQKRPPSPVIFTRRHLLDYYKRGEVSSGDDEECRERDRSFSEPKATQLTSHLITLYPALVAPAYRSACEGYGGGLRRDRQKNPVERILICICGGSCVEGVSVHVTSRTSTKTFDILSTDRESDALASLGVVPDGPSLDVDGAGSMTFVMYIAHHRVVTTILGRHAEYEVRVRGGGQRWSGWKRFTEFKRLAQCFDEDPASMKAWDDVIRAQPRRRCLHPEYLAQKCSLLEAFLEQVMFAIPSPALLIHFVSEK